MLDNVTETQLLLACRMRNKVMEVITYKQTERLQHLLREVEHLKIDSEVLRGSGIGVIVADNTVWPPLLKSRAQRLKSKWMEMVKTKRDALHGQTQVKVLAAPAPFAGAKAAEFLQHADDLATWCRSVDSVVSAPVTYRQAGLALASRGVVQWQELQGLTPASVDSLAVDPITRSAIARCVSVATLRYKASEEYKAESSIIQAWMEARDGVPEGSGNAQSSVQSLPSQVSEAAWQQHDMNSTQAGMSPFQQSQRPTTSFSELGVAMQRNPEAARKAMEDRRDMLARASVQGSAPMVRSALKLWHFFAMLMFGYNENATLPPKEARHVSCWLTMFRNPGTAQNYVSYLRWACRFEGFSLHWDTDMVKQTLNGMRKCHLKWFHGANVCKFKLRNHMVTTLYHFFMTAGHGDMACAILFNFEFCLRAKSEGMAVFKGSNAFVFLLPEHLPNGAWVNSAGNVSFRMRRRKHRPAGSLLTRGCCCGKGELPCFACEFTRRYEQAEVGQPLWNFRPAEFIARVRAALRELDCESAARDITFKSWRAGRATELARTGHRLGEILKAGEWAGAAVAFRYMDTDEIDPNYDEGKMLEVALENSEDDAPGGEE